MQIIRNVRLWQETRVKCGPQSAIGFVPTMGALHEGHRSLLQRSRQENQVSVLSIFVNPTQFNNPEDLSKYPKTWDSDLAMAKASGVDYVFAPEYSDLYPDQYRFKVAESGLSQRLCGAHRPGHFDGVLTVVMKLLHLVQPTQAYFGEKDFQQLQLVRDMVDAFFLPTRIVACPTVREKDGLAMSSRNLRLSEAARAQAPKLYALSATAKTSQVARQLLETAGFAVDYVEDVDGRRFVAASLEGIRLIDNFPLQLTAAEAANGLAPNEAAL